MIPILLCGKTGTKLNDIQLLLKSSRNIDTEIVYATEAISAKEENPNIIVIYINLNKYYVFDAIYHSDLKLSDKEMEKNFLDETYDFRLMTSIADIVIDVNNNTQTCDIVYEIWDNIRDKIGDVE